jgi:hypothetical protein
MTDQKLKPPSLRNAWLWCLVMGILGASVASAEPVKQREGWGLGLMLGYPVGLNAKYWLGGPNAVDVAIGGGPGFRVHGDYDWGLVQLLRNKSDLTLDLYLGVGGAVGFASGFCGYYGDRFCQDRFVVGARVPFGLDARLRRAPVNFGLELAPGIWVGNYVEGLFDVFLFVRFLIF